MIAILCIDLRYGLMFGGRRQSRDRLVLEDIQNLCGQKPLRMNEYSGRLFLQYGFPCPNVSEHFLDEAGPGDFCFVEDAPLSDVRDKLEKLILYQWNRTYPADLYFNPELINGWTRTETKEFSGSSHQTITREVYER